MKTSPATASVLSAVRSQSRPLSKAEIVGLTKLSLAAVTEHVDVLCEGGLLLAQSTGASSGGRKPKLYGFNPKAGCIAAIDLELVRVNVAILDFGMRILHAAIPPTRSTSLVDRKPRCFTSRTWWWRRLKRPASNRLLSRDWAWACLVR